MWLSYAVVVICASRCICYEGHEDTRVMARPYPAQKKIPFNRNIPILNAHKFIRAPSDESMRRNGNIPKVPWLKDGYTVFPAVRLKRINEYSYSSPFSLLPFPPDFEGTANRIHKKMLPDYGFLNLRRKRSAVAPKANASKSAKAVDAKVGNKKNVPGVRSKSQNKRSRSKAPIKGRAANKPAARGNKAKPQKKSANTPKQPAMALARNKKKANNKNLRTNSKAKASKKSIRSGPRYKNIKTKLRKPKNKRNRNVNRKSRNVKRTRAKPQGNKVRVGRRLIAGRDALIEEYPYVVSIQKDGEHWCGGALLNPRLVATTANCVWKSERVSRLRVRAGSRHSDHGGQKVRIQEMIRHPGWSIRHIPDNDVALLLLDENIKFSDSVHGVDLPNRAMYPAFADAWVTSWGSDRRDGMYDRLDLSLQSYRGHLMNRAKCNNITERFGVHVTRNFFCMTQAGKRAPCTRDTGAPAVSDGVLWGLASWGLRKPCGTERFPAMFTYMGSESVMNFIINATHVLMAEERKNPFLDRFNMYHMRARENNGTR